MSIDFESAADSLASADTTVVSRLSTLLQRGAIIQRRKENLERELKAVSKEERELFEDTIPKLLAEAGLREATALDGTKVTVENYYAASIPKDRQAEAYDWLVQHGHGDLIKNEVSVTFGRQENNLAATLITDLSSQGYPASQKQWVEPMTLKAFVKDAIINATEERPAPPTDLFGIFSGQKAKIKASKKGLK
jgi:hypothetical protein